MCRLVVAIEFERALESLARRSAVAGGKLGQPEVILDLGRIGLQARRPLEIREGSLHPASVELGRAALVELRGPPARAAEREHHEQRCGDRYASGRSVLHDPVVPRSADAGRTTLGSAGLVLQGYASDHGQVVGGATGGGRFVGLDPRNRRAARVDPVEGKHRTRGRKRRRP